MSAPHTFGITEEAKLKITAESLSDPKECMLLQVEALSNLAFFQSERRDLAVKLGVKLGEQAKARKELDLAKTARDLKAANTRDGIVSGGVKLTVSALDDKATIACVGEDQDVANAKEASMLADAAVTQVQEELSALKQIIEINNTIVIATMSALKQYRDIPYANA